MLLEVSVRIFSRERFGNLPGFSLESEIEGENLFQSLYSGDFTVEEFDAFAIQQKLHCYQEGVNTPERTRLGCPGLDLQSAHLVGYGKGYEINVFVVVYTADLETVDFSKYINEEANKRFTNKMNLIRQSIKEFFQRREDHPPL